MRGLATALAGLLMALAASSAWADGCLTVRDAQGRRTYTISPSPNLTGDRVIRDRQGRRVGTIEEEP